MMIVDLHNHAEFSKNTSLTLGDYHREGILHGAGGVAITEHNMVYPEERFSVGDPEMIRVFTGMEILNDYGDWLVFGVSTDVLGYRDIFDLIDCVHEKGGVIIAAHPYRGQGVFRATSADMAHDIIDRVDAVEVLNGRGDERSWRLAAELAAVHGKPCTGGSDAHGPGELYRAATMFHGPIADLSELIESIREGCCSPVRFCMDTGQWVKWTPGGAV